MERMSLEKLWPYILPLPTDPERQRQVLYSVFKSKASLDIIRFIPINGLAYQRQMVKKLSYSNKTIIKWSKILVSANLLIEGLEKIKVASKNVWIKWYKLTPLGKWIRFLLTPPEEISAEEIEDILKKLFDFYVKNTLRLCAKYGVDPKVLKSVFEKTYHQETVR